MNQFAVWKFQLKRVKEQWVTMHRGPQLLSVQLQGGEPVLWAVVNPDLPEVDRKILMLLTGEEHKFDIATHTHLGTVQEEDGIVLHFFSVET